MAAEAGALDPAELPAELGFRLAQVADQLDTDAALYQQGSLLAVSRPELALTGLLPPRPPPPAALAADRGEPVLSVHEAGLAALPHHLDAAGADRARGPPAPCWRYRFPRMKPPGSRECAPSRERWCWAAWR